MQRPLVIPLLLALLTLTGAADPPAPPSRPPASAESAAASTPKVSTTQSPTAKPTPEKPVAAIERVVIISCDGARPDVLLRARTPHVRSLIDAGSYTFWARTVPISLTLPSHTSMLTGVSPERHGIDWNDDRPDAGYPKVPTIFELAKRAGLTTGMATGKSKFATLARPGSVDWASIAAAGDLDVAARAGEIIASHKPNVMVVHFPGADQVGHAKGWGSKPQIAALEQIDEALGVVLKAIDDAGLRDSTVILFSADHGGAGRRHTGDDPRHRHIPWIITGPGIRKDHDLTSDPKLTVITQDTFATTCYLLGIEPGDVEGKPVLQILADRELLRSSSKK